VVRRRKVLVIVQALLQLLGVRLPLAWGHWHDYRTRCLRILGAVGV
jgi:hypothetical protein